MLSLGENAKNNIYPYDIDMNSVPKYIKIGTNLAISKSSKNKIKKAYGLKFRGKSKKQQKDMVMRQAKELRGGTRNFKNEKYAWRYLAQSYNVALKPIRKQAIEHKRQMLQRYNYSATFRWKGYKIYKGVLTQIAEGEEERATVVREFQIARWIEDQIKEIRETLEGSPYDKVEVEKVPGSETKTQVSRRIPLQYRPMRMAGVLDLDNMIENDYWVKRENMCVPDFIQFRYGQRKGFKKLTTDEAIEFWANHLEDITDINGYVPDEELELAGEIYKNPLQNGFCIHQIKNWCKKARVNMYAMVDNELIDHYYTEEARKRRNPPFVFEMKNNHLYPIIETSKIKAITNRPIKEVISDIKSNTQQEHEKKEKVEDQDEEIEFMDYELYESLEIKTKLNYALEVMCKNNKTTYPKKNLCLHNGQLHHFKIGKTKYLLRRPPMNDDDKEFASTTAKNQDKELKTVMKYCEEKGEVYNGQQPQYFTRQRFQVFSREWSSYFSDDVEHALGRKVKNRTHIGKVTYFDWRFKESREEEKYYWNNALSYDINKCYRSVMENPSEPFMLVGFNDTIKDLTYCDDQFEGQVDGKYPIGLYYVKTQDNMLFHYDNWYSSGMLNYAIEEDIDFEVKAYIPGQGLSHNPLKGMIQDIIEEFKEYPGMTKLIINSIWGYLMKTEANTTYMNVDENLQNVFDEHAKNQAKFNQKLMFTKYECESQDKTLYTYGTQKRTKIKSTNLPMAIQVCDQANIKLYELTKLMTNDFQEGKILYRNTDNVIVGYDNIDEAIKRMNPSKDIGGYSEKEFSPNGYEQYYPEKSYEDRRYYWRYDPDKSKWRDLPFNDSDDWLDIITELYESGGGQLLGRAGTGKSYVCIRGMEHLAEKGVKTKALAFTNKATIQLKGSTIHHFLAIDKEGRLNVKWARDQAKHIDLIFVDEISMISQHLWKLLSEFKYYTGIPFILVGDYRQLPPVDDTMGKWSDYFNHPTIRYLANNNRCELNQMKRYDIKLWNLLEEIWNNKPSKETLAFMNRTRKVNINDLINNKNICYTNKTRKIINEMVQDAIKPDDALLIKFKGEENKYNQDTYLFKGAKLIMYHTPKDKLFKKNEEVEVIDYDDEKIVITNGIDTGGYSYYNTVGRNIFHDCYLPGYATSIHKSQGDTIEGDINIFNVNLLLSGFLGNRPSIKALYTALSRGKSLDNIKICRL